MPDLALEREAIALFELALDIDENEREAWIAAQTEGRDALRGRLEAMLAAHESAQMRTGMATDDLEEEVPPERIGAYRVVERIGRGGMGSVYLGERMTGDFAHRAAIKVIKPGLLSDALAERFRRERQLLATLSHPHIARLYDGGETEAGSPYFIMEYVDGLPLLDWVADHAPSRTERQRLFRDICAAVAFAHRNLIVHRDLTPSNVLVTSDGVVKLIDFGIARPADDVGERRDSSRPSIASLSLTPGYAAPERMTSSAVTTASDIYSLGKLLEKLLPPEPGDRELKAILARATANDPLNRYPSADALGADIAAWHDGFPVAAMGGGRRYAAAKFVGRHRLGVAAASLALLLIVGALALTFGAYRSAEAARRAEAARFQDLRSLARYMLFDLNGRLARVAGNTAARAALANRAQTYLSALAASSGASAELRHEAAQGLIELAHVQGVPAQPNLGQTERARANLNQAVAMLRGLDLPTETKTPDLVQGLSAVAMIQAHTDTEVEAAGRTLVEAAQLLNAVPAGARGEPWQHARRQLRHAELELTVLGQKPDEMLRLANLMEAEVGQWPAAMQHSHVAPFDRAYAVYYRGLQAYFTDRAEPALALLRQADAMFGALDRARPNDPQTLYAAMWNAYVAYGTASGISGRDAESRHFLDLAVQTSGRLLQIEANDRSLQTFAGNLRQAQAEVESNAGHRDAAVAIQREVLRLYQAALGPERKPAGVNRLVTAQLTMGNIARAASNRDLACQSYAAARTLVAELNRRNGLLATTGRYVPGIEANAARCDRGAPLGEFTPIEQE